MARVILKKIKSQSMLEVIIALIIIMVVFTIGMMIYINVTSSVYSLQKLKAELLLQDLSLDMKKNKTFFDESIQKENIIIEKKISQYGEMKNLILVEFTATDQKEIKLAERRELINTETNE